MYLLNALSYVPFHLINIVGKVDSCRSVREWLWILTSDFALGIRKSQINFNFCSQSMVRQITAHCSKLFWLQGQYSIHYYFFERGVRGAVRGRTNQSLLSKLLFFFVWNHIRWSWRAKYFMKGIEKYKIKATKRNKNKYIQSIWFGFSMKWMYSVYGLNTVIYTIFKVSIGST